MINQQEKILIVDDELLIRKLLRQKLSFEGYQCDEAGSAEHALERLHLNPCNLVILDIKMPGKWGTELLPEIKATYPVIAVIMATAIAETSIAIQCMRQGADDYICKPFNLEQVSTSVLRTLEKQRLQLKIKEYSNLWKIRLMNKQMRSGSYFLEVLRPWCMHWKPKISTRVAIHAG